MPRIADRERPERLLDDVVAYLTRHGLAELSLRPLARAVGSSPRVLLYYFGSKDRLVMRVLAELRRRQWADIELLPSGRLAEDLRAVWQQLAAPDSVRRFRLFFEAFGIAMRKPRAYRQFLHAVVEDWLDMIADPLVESGASAESARATATIVVAGMRGYMLDLCATGDRARIDRAVRAWTAQLEAMS
jgi:AcrR family transcriptional regulator